MVADAEAKGFGKEPVKPAVAEPTTPVVADPAKKEEPAAGTEKKDAAATTTTEDAPSYSLEEDGFIGARDLATKIDSNEALKAALPKDVRDEIMANARLAETLAPYRDKFSSPEEADVIIQTAQEFAGYSEAFSSISRDVEKGTTAMINKLIEGSALLDAEGKPRKDPTTGAILTDGTAGKFLSKVFERGLALNVINKVKALNDPNVEAALDLVMESVGLRASTATEDTNQDPALKAWKEALDAQEARIKAERETTAKETSTSYRTALDTDLTSLYDGERKALLDGATGLSKFERESVESRLDAAVVAARKKNVAYGERLRQIQQQPMSAERRQREVALAKQFLRENLVRIAKPILLEAGVTVGKKAEERAAAAAARAEGARSEVSGGTATSAQPQNPGATYEQQRSAVIADLKNKNGGKEPSDSEVSIALMMAAAARKGFGQAA
jgi:hypothetical protein